MTGAVTPEEDEVAVEEDNDDDIFLSEDFTDIFVFNDLYYYYK